MFEFSYCIVLDIPLVVIMPNIYNKFETAQCELQLSDDTDYSLDRQQFQD